MVNIIISAILCFCEYIKIITSAATWLLNFQSKDGYFVENVSYDNIASKTRKTRNHVALTAHVLIALEETADVIQVL